MDAGSSTRSMEVKLASVAFLFFFTSTVSHLSIFMLTGGEKGRGGEEGG